MSIRLVALIWEYQFSHPEQSIMQALADHADDDGTHVFPSVAYTAWKTDYSERQVQRIMRDLQAKGILVPVRNWKGGRGKTTEYHIHLEKGVKKTPFRKKGDMADEKGDMVEIKDDAAMTPEPSIEPSIESSEGENARAREIMAQVERLQAQRKRRKG